MSYIDSVLNGTYSQGNYKKKREQEKESYVDKVLNGTYEIGSYRSKKQEEVIQESNNKDLGLLGKFLKQGKEMEDGYQFGDVTKMVLGTGNDLIQKTTKGLLSPVESVLDIGTNLIASGLSTGSGALGIKNEKLANDLREFADKDLTAIATKTVENVNPIGMAYNIVNGTPQKIINPAEIEWDKEKNIFENYGAGLEKAWATDREEDYEKSSVAGEYTGKIAELVGHTLGLKLGGEMMAGNTAKVGTEKLGASISKGNIGFNLAGHTLNLPTLAIAGGMAGGLQEANSKENVNEAERWGKALSGGLMEGFTEGLFGMLGVGGNDVTEKLASKLASQFSSKAGKTLAQIGISASGEAAEEFLSYAGNFFIDNGIIDKLGEADFKAEWDWGEVGEQMALAFISSALTSGADTKISNNSAIEAAEQQLGRKLNRAEKAQVTQAMIDGTIQEKIDALNAYTDNETKVYDSLMNEKFNTRKTEIAKENEYNTKIEEQQNMLARDLTEQEQIQLRKEIDERFENEEISLDDIELTKEEMKEFAQSTQEDIESGNLSKDKIREILGENVDISNDRRLQKSYVQSHNKQTVYDYQKTDSVAKNAVMESAAKANMNNTEMSRNFVDYVSKISEDTGVTYRFANTGQLKQLGYTIEDKTVDGVVTKDGTIYINPQSKDAINYVLGHETTHLLESTQEYTKLQEMIVKYAQQKGIYEEALENIKSRYSNILETNEEFMQELTSDLSSRILFSDEAFIQELSVKEPNIFQKFYDFIKHTLKMTTAGSKEAKQLEKIKYSFDKAYKSLNKTNSSKIENNRFSIQTDNNGNRYVKVDTDQNIFDGIDKKDYKKIAKMYIEDYLLGDTKLSNNDIAIIDKRSSKKYTNPGKTQNKFYEKMQLTPELKNVLEVSEKVSEKTPVKENSKYSNWEYYKFNFSIDGNGFEGLINIGIDSNGNKHFYEINNIKETSILGTSLDNRTGFYNNSIPSTNTDVNTTTKYSIQESDNNSNIFDEIVPEGNNYKVTAEDVELEKTNRRNNEELSNSNDTTVNNTNLLEYLDKHKIDYEILENGEIQTNEVDIFKILDKIAENKRQQEENKSRSKAVQYANKAKNKFVKQFTQDMNLNRDLNKQLILNTLNQVEQEISQNGKLSNEKADEIFNNMYSQLLEKEGEYYINTVDDSFKILDRENFDRNLDLLINELKLADRYNKEEMKNNTTINDVGTLKEVYKQLSVKQKEYEKATNKELLTQRDKAQVDRLINQEITIDELPSDVNKKGILNIYNTKKDLVELQKITQNYRKSVVTENRQLAKHMTKNVLQWKDKASGWKYQINTMKRNLRDIIPNKAEAQDMYDTYFRPITKNNAQIEKSINSYNDRIEVFNINNQESTYIQMIGESKYNPESKLPVDMVEDFYNKHKNKIDKEKCNQAVEEFRAIYDELIEQINDVLIANGYKPIEYREGYFPHFIEDKAETVIGKMAEKMGWKIKKDTLPTDIAGITDTFKPGKSWTSFSQQRMGDATDYNVLKGFDNYIRGAMDVIYHTEDIQRLRALENEIRYQYSNDGIKEQIDNIYTNNELDTQEKEIQINNLLDNIKNAPMGNLVTELKNYTNNLANKKATSDRGMEEFWGRKSYSIMSNVQNRVSANMVGANIASATTNFIPITQAWSQTSTKNIMRGIKESIATCFKDDGFADSSTFLVNRTQSADRLYKTSLDSINNKLGFVFDKVDEFTSNTIVRAKYYDNIEKGMSMQEAMNNADEFAKDIIAGRSKGDMPTVFNKKNPLVKLFTAFQLEVNNQYGYMFKDIPSDLADEGKGKLIGAFIKMFLGAFLYNKLSEEITGRKSAFSPIDMAIEGYTTVTNENMGVGEKVEAIASNVAGELPFVSGVVGGGRLPIQAALPDASELISNASDLLDMNVEDKSKAIKSLGKEISKPLYYVALPFAGGQIKKTIEGLSMYNDDLPTPGSYTNSGKLRYTVSDDIGTKIKAGIFGQYSVKEAQEYFEKGYAPLTEKQTQELIDLDVPISDYRKYKDKLKEIDKTKKENISNETSKLQMKLDYISGLDLTNEQKNILANNATTRKDKIDIKKYEEYNNLEEMDYAIKNPSTYKVIKTVTDFKTYNEYKEEISNIKKKYSSDAQKKRAVVDYINELPLEVGQKAVMIKINYTGIKDNNAIIVDYINNLNINHDDKIEIFEKLGFKYKGGRIYE